MAQAHQTIQRITFTGVRAWRQGGEMFKFALRTFAATLILGSVAATFSSTSRAQDAAPAAAPSTSTAGASEAAPGEKKFTLVAEQIGDTKFWFPSTIVAEPG